MQSEIARKRFTVEAYHRMHEAGILMDRERVELIDGEVLLISPIGGPHAAATNRADRLFTVAFGDDALVRVQLPLVLGDWSEPEPDVCVVRPREDFYAGGHPEPGDVLFLMEISDTTLDFDRTVKLDLYRMAGVPEVWILDIGSRTLSVHRDVGDEGYGITETLASDDTVSPRALPYEFDVSALLP